jgi:hypothetical protein
MAGTGTTIDPGTLVGNALDSVTSGVHDVAAPALAIGGSILALSVGWKFAKKFVRG